MSSCIRNRPVSLDLLKLTVTDFVFVFLILAKFTPFVVVPLGFGIVGLEYLWLGLTPASGPVVFFQFPDCHFVAMSPLYIGSFCFVDCLLLFFFLWVLSTCVLICLLLVMDEFLSLIFISRVFSSFIF